MVTVCVDAMGGDESSDVVLEGIHQALVSDPELQVLVAGLPEVVEPFCATHARTQPLVCTQTISMEEHPATAVRTKRDSSIVCSCRAVKDGRAQGFFSAGSTGAIFTAATLEIGRIRTIKRPAIAYAVPGLSGKKTVFLDLGANADARPATLVQFAYMGRAYARNILHVKDPSVALLSNGTEPTKGSEAVIAAHKALAEAGPWFSGNCESSDILAGKVDVVVTDGFTGNIVLKMIEGTVKYLYTQLKGQAAQNMGYAVGLSLAKGALKRIAVDLSGEEQGGAMLLGLKAPVLIGHGSTSVAAIKHGTLACAHAIRSNLVSKIASDLVRES